jgi:hypothetical protein
VACQRSDIARPPAADGTTTGIIPSWAATLVVFNPLSAVIRISVTGAPPTATSYDVIVPGNSLFQWPLFGNSTQLTAVVDYPGAVPADEANTFAVIGVMEADHGAFVGSLV